MPAEVTVMMAADDKRLRAVHEKLLRDQQKILDKYAKLASQSQKSAEIARKEQLTRREAAKAEKEYADQKARAAKLTEQSLTPQERLVKRAKELQKLRQAKEISGETARRQLRAAIADMKAEEKAIERSSEAYKRKTETAREARSVIDRLRTSSERYRRDLRKLVKAKREGIISSDELRKRHIQLKEEFGKHGKMQGVVKSLSQIAGAYVSLQGGIQAVIATYQEQVDVQERSLYLTKQLAAAQERAAKNFAGLLAGDSAEMQQAAREIQAKTYFPEITELTNALGTAVSASADKDLARRTVEELAPLSRNDPASLESFVLGTLNTARALDTENVQKSAGLLLGIGSAAQVTDPQKLARAVGPVLQAAVNSLPDNASQQLRERAAIDAGGLLAALTKAASDEKGESSVTAFIQMNEKLSEFFDAIPEQIESRRLRLKQLGREEEVTDQEKDNIARRRITLARAERALQDAKTDPDAGTFEGKLQIRDAEIDVRSARRELSQEIAGSTLSKEDIAERKQLREQLAAFGKFQQGSPALVGRQIQALQQSSVLASLFQEDAGDFGEQRFKDAFDSLLSRESRVSQDFMQFTRGAKAIRVSDAKFQELLNKQRATPAMRTSDFATKVAAAKQMSDLNQDQAFKQAVAEAVLTASQKMTATHGFLSGDGFFALEEMAMRNIQLPRIRNASSPMQALQLAEDFLSQGTIRGLGFSDEEEARRSSLDTVKALVRTLDLIREEMSLRRNENGALDNAAGKLEGAANNMARPGAGANAQAGAAVGVGAQ